MADATVSAACQINKNGYNLTVTGNFLALKNYANTNGYYDVVAVTASKVKIVGSHSSWRYTNANSNTMYQIDGTHHYVATDVKFTLATQFKFLYDDNWKYAYGATDSDSTANTVNVLNTCSNMGNINIVAGTYDIYWTGGKYYVSNASGAANLTKTAKASFYLLPSKNWTVDNARFAAHFYGGTSSEMWVDMKDTDNDGLYEVTLPTGNYKYVIFVRMDPSKTDNNWDNKWNQTKDDSSNHFNVDGNTGKLHAISQDEWDDVSCWME